jgi:hypothetical protein
LGEESDGDHLLLRRLKLILLRLNREDFSGDLLLTREVILDRVLSIVSDSDGVLLWLSNSDGTEVKNLIFFLSNLDMRRNLEGFSLNLNGLGLLLDSMVFSVFNFESDGWLELVFLLSFEGKVDDLLLARLESSTGK